jgi:hypothetical protein
MTISSSFFFRFIAGFASVFPAVAGAHISYGGRDFGLIPQGGAQLEINAQTVSSSFGWADATDADFGDSHRGRFYRFSLAEPMRIELSAQRIFVVGQTGAADVFRPGVSVFAGLAQLAPETAAHDGASLSVASRPLGTEGSFRSVADWSIGNDGNTSYPARLASFTHVGHAADAWEGEPADGAVSLSLDWLPAGDYSIFVGGADYLAQLSETPSFGPAQNSYPSYGVRLSLTATPIPEPAAAGLWSGLAAGVFFALRRKKR